MPAGDPLPLNAPTQHLPARPPTKHPPPGQEGLRRAAPLPCEPPLCPAPGQRQHHRLHHAALRAAAAHRARAGRGRGRDCGRHLLGPASPRGIPGGAQLGRRAGAAAGEDAERGRGEEGRPRQARGPEPCASCGLAPRQWRRARGRGPEGYGAQRAAEASEVGAPRVLAPRWSAGCLRPKISPWFHFNMECRDSRARPAGGPPRACPCARPWPRCRADGIVV